MWQVIYVATSKAQAVNIKNRLEKEGFMIKMEAISKGEYQLKVLESEAADAYGLLTNF